MTSGGDVKATISEVMETNGFTGESRFYRYTLPEFLEALEEPGTFRISANPDPSEAVVDIYRGGHIVSQSMSGRVSRSPSPPRTIERKQDAPASRFGCDTCSTRAVASTRWSRSSPAASGTSRFRKAVSWCGRSRRSARHMPL